MSLNIRYPDFNEAPVVTGDMVILVYDPVTDLLYKTTVSKLVSKTKTPDFWQDNVDYVEGDLTTYIVGVDNALQAFIAVNPSLNSPPSESNPDWRIASSKELDILTYDGSGPSVVLSGANLTSAIFKQQDIDGNKVWSSVNSDNLLEFTVFVNLIGVGTWDQDFTAIGAVSDNGLWADGVWSPNQPGKYKLEFKYTGFEYFLTISNLAA